MTKSLSEIKDELVNNISLATTNDLVNYYDIISGSNFSEKIQSRFVNENKYLDKKIRMAIFQLIRECSKDQIEILYEVVLGEDVETVRTPEKKSYQPKIDAIIKEIDKEYNLNDYEYNISVGILSLDIAETPEHPWMDIMDFIYERFIDAEDANWKYMGHSGGVLNLQLIFDKTTKEETQKEITDDIEYDSYNDDMEKTKDLKEKDFKDPNEQPKDEVNK